MISQHFRRGGMPPSPRFSNSYLLVQFDVANRLLTPCLGSYYYQKVNKIFERMLMGALVLVPALP